jgi:hypothetical protein
MKTARAILCFVFFVGLFLVTSPYAYAQTFAIDTGATLKLTPSYPEPNAEVVVALDAYSIDTTGSSITWFIDDKEVPEAKNTREMTFTIGPLGTPIRVQARLTSSTGGVVTASHTITPVRVDLVVEANTLTPLHYKGRALPSSGSTLRVIALPDTNTDPSNLSYTWTVDNEVLFGGSLRGKNVAEFTTPQQPNIFLTLEVAAAQGEILARRSILINIARPTLRFYEDNPLRGLSRNTLKSPHMLIGDEMSVRAEPYFMNKNIFESEPLIEWEIDNSRVENTSDQPQNITLRSIGKTGNSNVSFHIRNLQDLLQGIEDDFVVSF